jgi:aspartyl-tRNA(Asn)/glutamyl-tRNA(Gln) amidotransferase subunit A
VPPDDQPQLLPSAGPAVPHAAVSRRAFVRRAAALGLSLTATRALLGAPAARVAQAQQTTGALPATIAEAGRRLRDGSLTSQALTAAYLACIRSLEPQLNMFITLTEERALATTAARDAELAAGVDRGPLHGIPIVQKDIFDTAGVTTTVGARFFRDRVPGEDATTVQRLEAAGVVTLGKTNMNEFAAGVSGTNAFYGDTHNPWRPGHSPGGSSSGTGAAIAAGLCLGGTGTDTGGSIRVPAAWCGIAGIRPTYGLVSLAGVFPRAFSLDTAGPLAPTVADVAVLLDTMAGFDPRDPNSALAQRRPSYTGELDRGVNGFRLGIVEDYTFRDIDPDVAAAVRAAVDTFADLGAEIVSLQVPAFTGELEFSRLFNNILLFEFNQILGEQVRAAPNRQELFGPIVLRNIEVGERVPREVYEQTKRDRPFHIARVKQAFETVDALLTPASPTVAPPLDAPSDVFDRQRQFALPFSWTALPSVVIPAGFSADDLPVGLQIAGNHFEEALILRIAAAYQAATDFHLRRPPIFCPQTATMSP